jgi:hypothetical protein
MAFYDPTATSGSYDVNMSSGSMTFVRLSTVPASLEPTSFSVTGTAADVENPLAKSVYVIVRRYVHHFVMPVVMFVGVVGNAASLNLARRFRTRQSALERSAVVALVALAISDLLFCVVGLPQFFLTDPLGYTELSHNGDGDEIPATSADDESGGSDGGGNSSDAGSGGGGGDDGALIDVRLVQFSFYYAIYRVPLHNTFLFCSTWIIVVMSAERCLAVRRPIQARLLTIRARRSVAVYAAVFVMSAGLCAPMFVKYRIVDELCGPRSRCLYIVPTALVLNAAFRRMYHVIWTSIGTLVPLVCLVVTGTTLVTALRARRQQRTTPSFVARLRCCRLPPRLSPTTKTVVATVMSFFVLVCPSTMVETIGLLVGINNFTVSQLYIYQSVLVLTNLCQAVKFSGNFVVYFRGLSRRASAADTSGSGPIETPAMSGRPLCGSSGRLQPASGPMATANRGAAVDDVTALALAPSSACGRVEFGLRRQLSLSKQHQTMMRYSSTAADVTLSTSAPLVADLTLPSTSSFSRDNVAAARDDVVEGFWYFKYSTGSRRLTTSTVDETDL